MIKTTTIVIATFASLTVVSLQGEDAPKKSDALSPVLSLEGKWQGESEGFGQKSKVTHEWKRVLGGKFLRLTTRSVAINKDGKETVHEDVGYISYSKDEKVFRFRQFLSEGFVNTFRVEPVAKNPNRGFNFEPESTEGFKNLSARMTLRFDKMDGYEMILELGTKGKKLKPCQSMKLKKVRTK